MPPDENASTALFDMDTSFNCSADDAACLDFLAQLYLLNKNLTANIPNSPDNITVYGAPIVLFIGTVGNILSLITLFHFLREKTVYLYLFALAIVDLFVLYVGLFEQWLNFVMPHGVNKSGVGCKISAFFCYAFSYTSVWLIVAVTFERYLAVCHEMKVGLRKGYDRKRTIAVIVLIFLLAGAASLHFIWTLGVNGTPSTECQPSQKYLMFVRIVWPWIDIMLYFFVPGILIFVLNGIILWKIRFGRCRMLKMERNILKVSLIKHDVDRNESTECISSTSQRNAQRSTRTQFSHMKKSTRMLTLMLVLISLSFLFTTLPFVCMIILLNSWTDVVTASNQDLVFSMLSFHRASDVPKSLHSVLPILHLW